jgi:predicted transcriptional regulator
MAAEQRRTLLDKWQLMKRLDCDPRLSRADLAVMRAILDRLNDEGICWPSFDTLADDTEQARRSAVRSVERLIRCRLA